MLSISKPILLHTRYLGLLLTSVRTFVLYQKPGLDNSYLIEAKGHSLSFPDKEIIVTITIPQLSSPV